MAVPSKNFTNVPDGDIDADSPLTETLMTQIRDSLVHLEEWLGVDFIAAQNHDHDGVNSKNIPAGAIDSTIVSEGYQSIAYGSRWTPVAGIYNFIEVGNKILAELNINSTWRQGDFPGGVTVICDGVNMRFYNWGGSSYNAYYQKF